MHVTVYILLADIAAPPAVSLAAAIVGTIAEETDPKSSGTCVENDPVTDDRVHVVISEHRLTITPLTGGETVVLEG